MESETDLKFDFGLLFPWKIQYCAISGPQSCLKLHFDLFKKGQILILLDFRPLKHEKKFDFEWKNNQKFFLPRLSSTFSVVTIGLNSA